MDRSEIERLLATRLPPVARAWHRCADQMLAGLGVSNSSGWCLVHLKRLGQNVRQIELARELDIRGASLARTLDQLSVAGLVDRLTDPADARANNLRLTEKGGRLAIDIENRLIELRAELLSAISSEDLLAAWRVCNALGDAIAIKTHER
ncbi:Transcriptional regulator SlyA [compost metagenome]|jgi:MarR family transcriptional regulator for hemolysin